MIVTIWLAGTLAVCVLVLAAAPHWCCSLIAALLDVGSNVSPDNYPGAIPAGTGGFLPSGSGRPGEQYYGGSGSNPGARQSYGSGLPGSSPYQDSIENCRNIYNGINAVSQDRGHPGRGVSNDPGLTEPLEAMESCYKDGFSPNLP